MIFNIVQEQIFFTFLSRLTVIDLRFIGIVITAIGVIAAIGTFIYQQRKTRKNRKEDSRSQWISSIIIQPRLDSLNKFYKKCTKDILKSLTEVEDLINEKVSSKELRKQQAVLIRRIKDKKTKFINDFISLIAAYDLEKGKRLSNIINDLDDIINEYVGVNGVPSEIFDEIELESEINKNKANFLKELYSLVHKN